MGAAWGPGGREHCRRELLGLSMHACGHNGESAGEIERVIETNGFVVEDGTATVVFRNISRCNHDCASNARFRWDAPAAVGIVECKCDISAGSEVTLNYGASGNLRERQAHLLSRFGFTCACALCESVCDRDPTTMRMPWRMSARVSDTDGV